MSNPNVHKYLDASTAHLPQAVFNSLTSLDGVVTTEHNYGVWLWVPSDIAAWVEDYSDTPAELVTLLQFARKLDCDWINLDSDAGCIDGLPMWEW